VSTLLAFYLLAINAVTFGAFALDKQAARRDARRVPERYLLTLSMIGGTVGAIAAQQLLRHKSRKEPFRSTLWAVAALHLILIAVIVYRAR
jgi:uncharacterized membrane protein YsdA (DUF1294 family)